MDETARAAGRNAFIDGGASNCYEIETGFSGILDFSGQIPSLPHDRGTSGPHRKLSSVNKVEAFKVV